MWLRFFSSGGSSASRVNAQASRHWRVHEERDKSNGMIEKLQRRTALAPRKGK
jgi:hypothetical protein